MPKFRKKPIVIEAVHFDGSPESASAICRWTNDNPKDPMNEPSVDYVIQDGLVTNMECATLEGFLHVSPGDWMIKGVNGEFYPCKPDIFEKTYERVDVPTAIDRHISNGLFTTKNTEVYGGNEVFNALHDFEVRGTGTDKLLAEIHFQEGPIKECGVNGVCNEDLLLMVITRLQMFQDSPYKCRENAVAITKLEEAAMWLRKRTMDREARNVEGTHVV